MAPTMAITADDTEPARTIDELPESQYQKGVKHLCENGITSVPNKYILPVSERPRIAQAAVVAKKANLKLPIIDLAEMCGPNRARVIESLATACQEHGFFQVVNHGIGIEVIRSMIDVSTRFFDLPYEERAKYMSADMSSTVRYGTSFNQTKDSVFCWRDFLKLMCQPMSDVLPHWPSSPVDFRELAATYAEETKKVYEMIMEAIVESLGLKVRDEETEKMIKELGDGSQLMVVNCYPPCPEPDLTLGMPPHSDYGFLTLLLQDDVHGLQIHHNANWVTVDPIPNSFVVNVGDHLEIFSNGKYKSVLHRVLTNSKKNRVSVASLHSLPFNVTAKPFPGLISQASPRRYMDTDFSHFLNYLISCEPKEKSFLETRKLS